MCNYEKAMSAVAWGPYQKRLTIVAGFINASDSIAVTAMSFVIPNAGITLSMSAKEKGWLMSVVFIGMMVGGLLWGSAGDSYGRRRCLMFSLSTNGLASVVSSVAPSFSALMLFQFVSGVGVGGTIPLVFTFFSECLPIAKRGQYVVILASFWMVGSIFVATLAWFVIPMNSVFFTIGGMDYTSWRMFLLLTGTPSLLCAISLRMFYESPRYYYNNGYRAASFNILSGIHEYNTGEYLPDDIRNVVMSGYKGVSDQETAPLLNTPVYRTPVGTTHVAGLEMETRNGWFLYRRLLSPPLRRTTLQLSLLWATLSYGYYGLTSWMPEYFKLRFAEHEIHSSLSIYQSTFIVAIAQLPANLLSAYSVDWIGRESSEAIVTMSAIFSGVSVAGWNSLDIISSENFPTDVRSTGFGLLTVVGRISSIIATATFGQLVYTNPAYPILLTAVFLLIGCVTAIRIPEVKRGTL
eukprot:CFRG3006T1